MGTIDTIYDGQVEAKSRASESLITTGLIAGVIIRLRYALVRRRTRIQLSELTGEQLKDIGVSTIDARRESERFCWDGRE